MAIQFQTIAETDFGQGIDQSTSEDQIKPGSVEEMENFNPQREGYLSKRVGYQGHAGNIPLRVTRVEYTTDSTENLSFVFDGAITLSSIRNSPIVVYGRTSQDNALDAGDFPYSVDSVHYYTAFIADARKIFVLGVNQTLPLPQTEHTLSTEFMWLGTTASTSTTDNSNSVFIPDLLTVHETSYDATITYTNGTPAFDGFVYTKDASAVSGTSYVSAAVPSGTGTKVTTISAATHGLSNFNILVKVHEDNTPQRSYITPDEVLISPSGDVTITTVHAVSTDLYYMLVAVPFNQINTGTVGASSTATVSLTGLTSPFLFVTCYLEQTLGGIKEEVIPDSIAVDDLTSTATVSFTNNSPSAANFIVMWDYGAVKTNKLSVDAAVIGTAFADDSPQLTVWGLDHSEIYEDSVSSERPGWVNHIDSYRSEGETRVISGLGGNLFGAYTRDELGSEYLMPQLFVDLRNRAASTKVLAPLFWDSSDTSSRTRGYIKLDGGTEHESQAVSITYDSGLGWVKYTLACPNLSIVGTLASTVSIHDVLSVRMSGYSVHTGEFSIRQITNPSANVIAIWVENTSVDSSDYDETDSGAQCGVFTDEVTLLTTTGFLAGDQVDSEVFENDILRDVVYSQGTSLFISGISEELNIPTGLRFFGSRTSSLIPIRTSVDVSAVTDLVRGDMIQYANTSREFRIKYINADSNRIVSITATTTEITCTMASGTNAHLWVGQKILLKEAGDYTGVYTISELSGASVFILENTSGLTSAGSGTLQGNLIEVDEDATFLDDVTNSNTITVTRRWIPVEAPDDSYDLTPQSTVTHFTSGDFSNQSFLRSVMVSDNLYLQNGVDTPSKFDGFSIYRAGLPRWQPHLFVSVSTAATNKIDIPVISCAVSLASSGTNKFSVAAADIRTFLAGDEIEHSGDNARYIVTEVDSTNNKIIVNGTITSATTGTLTKVQTYRYYFRLNAVDANNNIVASASVGSGDFKVKLIQDSQIRIRMIGLPAWDLYDYDTLEVEVYRTTLNTVAPFYNISKIPLNLTTSNGYVDFIDTLVDDELLPTRIDLLATNSGAELPNGIAPPLRSKYVTTAGNRLILGNVKGYPSLDIRFQRSSSSTAISNTDLSSKTIAFRKDNTSSYNTTDMLNYVKYEFKTSGTLAITAVVAGSGQFTVTAAGHGLAAGNWVYLFRLASPSSDQQVYTMGWWQVYSVSGNDFVIKWPDVPASLTLANEVDRCIKATSGVDIPVYLGQDYNYNQVNGNDDSDFTFVRRLGDAVNASQRQCTTSNFIPWIVAAAGAEYQAGQIVISQPKTIDTNLEVDLPAIFTDFQLFVNSVKRLQNTSVSASTKLFPSRILASYVNFPEMFDSPLAELDSFSRSAVDVNSADGQEITGIIPFFGDSAFGAAQQSGIIVVFKTNSIYLVDFNAKDSGQNAVQRIESEGRGCTAPYSIAVTRNGIMFANEAGIFRLNRNLQIDFIGEPMLRYWQQRVNRDQLEIMQGHQYGIGSQYKVSVPQLTESSNSTVIVYDHTRETSPKAGGPQGSWTTYTNHPVIGWANLSKDAYFASTLGRVFVLRRAADVTDYRDDSTAIEAAVTLRAMNFGDSGIRKLCNTLLVTYRVLGQMTGTQVFSATNLTENFQELDQGEISTEQNSGTGLSDLPGRKIDTIQYSVGRSKFNFLQLKFTNATIDEPVDITSVSYRVAGLSPNGLRAAAKSGTEQDE